MRAAWLLVGLLAAGLAQAADGGPDGDARPFKLTLGSYRYDGYSGTDLNLRWRRADTSAWIAAYRDREFGTQTRVGADTSINLLPQLLLQPSLQVASRGFVGGSVNLQAGDAWFGLVGLGRTNLKPYFNLNFDPNDAITLGAGHRTEGGSVYTLFVVADDRLHTQQKHWHLNARVPIGGSRLTLDLLHKTGEGDAGHVDAWGWSVGCDWPSYFVRLARDPKQNFSAQDAWRLAAGLRF
jgi:hypothetical protein